ncbi:MAG: archease [Nitrospira sp. CG24D]|nr:MAG: archease [Nitrospira sp. CG24D]
MPASFLFLDDVALADLAFDAEGDSVPEVFEAASNAVMEAMADPKTVGATWERCVEHVAADLAELLFDWLSDFVYWKDAAGVVFSRASISLIQAGGQWTLAGTLIGEPVNQATQMLRNDVKGVTKHLYRLRQDNGRWRVRVVLDV